ncbi:hypothetical protein [Phocaeicola coprocola]|uniref:hypothetical protein n=1 Tax=Phocaeicola coprocola TaxID=310298 RepID=UPI00243103BD|nr:hypothetical protein [Phocaeicola coprocola]
MIRLTIGNLHIQLEGIDRAHLPANTLLFESTFEEADLYYTFHIDQQPRLPNTPPVYRKPDILVFRQPSGLESRLLILPDGQAAYAYLEETDSQHTEIYFNPAYTSLLSTDTIFHSMLALEKHLVLQNSFAFHCAYLDFEGKAILFSGPSGIGKTTHTNLWCQYLPDQAKVLNGDKCLLSREGNTFYANGWPICGSSGICHNERREVRAVVLLQQAPENRLIEEKKILTFRRVLEQLTVNYWNREFTEAAMTFADSLVSTLPCFTYGCNISREAVDILYQQLITSNK